MISFLQQNWVTIITILVLVAVVTLIIKKLVKDKKSGIGPCGKKCSQCQCFCSYSQK